MRRFRLVVNAGGRGSLIDVDTGLAIDGVRAVAVVARIGELTRVVVEFLAADVEVEAEAPEVEAVDRVEVVGPVA